MVDDGMLSALMDLYQDYYSVTGAKPLFIYVSLDLLPRFGGCEEGIQIMGCDVEFRADIPPRTVNFSEQKIDRFDEPMLPPKLRMLNG